MSDILLYYRRPDPTTWVYLSSFLTIGLFFVFHRFWSIRNLDIVLLILLAPGLLMVHEGRRRQLRELESKAVAARALNSEPDVSSRDGDANSDDSVRPLSIPTNAQLDAAATLLALSPIAAVVQVGDPVGEDSQSADRQAAQSPEVASEQSGSVASEQGGSVAVARTKRLCGQRTKRLCGQRTKRLCGQRTKRLCGLRTRRLCGQRFRRR